MGRWLRIGKTVLVWVVSLYLANLFLGQGWAKFDAEGRWTEAFQRWGYPVWLRVAVGAVETGGALGLLLPPVAFFAALALGAVMLGAIFTRAGDGRWVDVAWNSGYLVALLWVAWERRGRHIGGSGRCSDPKDHSDAPEGE